MTKPCTLCNEKKSFDQFNKNAMGTFGLYSRCKSCQGKSNAAWHLKNKERRNQAAREWHRNNHEKSEVARKKWYAKNREQVLAYSKKWFHANRDKVYNNWLKRNYKIDINIYRELLKKQSGLCAGCGRARKLIVDHNHKTGAVRGLLCDFCNKAIGYARDSVQILKATINYLHSNNKPEAPF